MKLSQTVEIPGIGDVEFTFSLYMESTGVGAYEYQGFKGYDTGFDYYIVDDFEWDKNLYTDKQNAFIKEFTESKMWESIEDKLCKESLIKEY
jgi:hypothetical protein